MAVNLFAFRGPSIEFSTKQRLVLWFTMSCRSFRAKSSGRKKEKKSIWSKVVYYIDSGGFTNGNLFLRHMSFHKDIVDYSPQVVAQSCILAVQKTVQWIEKAKLNVGWIQKSLNSKSKKDYNHQRKRDFQRIKYYGSAGKYRGRISPEDEKVSGTERSQPAELNHLVSEIIDQFRGSGNILSNFDCTLSIHLTNQNIGDEGLITIAGAIKQRIPLKCFVLSGNRITDKGFSALTAIFDYCNELEELLLQDNELIHAVEALHKAQRLIPKLRLLNLGLNPLSTKSFYHLGAFIAFTPVNFTLFIGMIPNANIGVRILVSFLFSESPISFNLEALHVPQCNLDEDSLNALSVLLLLQPSLKLLDLNRNPFPTASSKAFFLKAFGFSSYTQEVATAYCGLPQVHHGVSTPRFAINWEEEIDFAFSIASAINVCHIEKEKELESFTAFCLENRPAHSYATHLNDVVEKWRVYKDDVQHDVEKMNGREGSKSDAYDTVLTLIHAVEVCLEQSRRTVTYYTDALKEAGVHAVIEAMQLHLVDGGSALMNSELNTLQRLIGTTHLSSEAFQNAEGLLFATRRNNLCLAYVHFITQIYPVTLARLHNEVVLCRQKEVLTRRKADNKEILRLKRTQKRALLIASKA